MRCPFCEGKTRVTNKRDVGSITRRRRECLKCKRRFTTHEEIHFQEIIVIKKDNRREVFNRDKIVAGIKKACEKRPVSQEKIEKTVNEIEEKLRKYGREVRSKVIGELVMNALKKLDKVAYIRFASVYRAFKDLGDFKKEIKEITKK